MSVSHDRPQEISRRALAKGAAWAAPIIAVASTAPVTAASVPCGGSLCRIDYGGGSINGQTMGLYYSFVGSMRAGECVEIVITADGSTAYVPGVVPGGGREILSYAANGDWTASATSSVSGQVNTTIVTISARRDFDWATYGCTKILGYDSAAFGAVPGATMTSTIQAAGVGGAGGTLKWRVPLRKSTSKTRNQPHYYIAKSGDQLCFPEINWAYQSGATAAEGSNGSSCGAGGNNTSTTYPDGSCEFVKFTSAAKLLPAKC